MAVISIAIYLIVIQSGVGIRGVERNKCSGTDVGLISQYCVAVKDLPVIQTHATDMFLQLVHLQPSL
jgi:hypothetical protein